MSSDRLSLPSQSREIVLLCTRTLGRLLSGEEGKVVEAGYLWGSIVRPDFVPGRSDIDSVLIGDGPGLEEACRWVSRAVVESEPALCLFKARPLYRDDLNGKPPRSELARLIHPKVLLADFENWELVLGRRLAREDFRLAPGSLSEILALRLEALRRRLSIHNVDPEREPARYIFKELGFICHVLHQLRVGPHRFSYPALVIHADERTREAVETISALRELDWEDGACRQALGMAERFLELRE
jgi:predicted nucleotidyltransferase